MTERLIEATERKGRIGIWIDGKSALIVLAGVIVLDVAERLIGQILP